MGLIQVAIFKNVSIKSSVTNNLKSSVARNGIRCELGTFPEEPKSSGVLKNGEWVEVSNGSIVDNDNEFSIDLDATDNAASSLISSLKKKKTIDEIVIYELATTDNKPSYAYYMNKVFIKGASTGIDQTDDKVLRLKGVCTSFKQRTADNYEPVLWDSETMSHIYTGGTK
jgi:hypothetical protein